MSLTVQGASDLSPSDFAEVGSDGVPDDAVQQSFGDVGLGDVFREEELDQQIPVLSAIQKQCHHVTSSPPKCQSRPGRRAKLQHSQGDSPTLKRTIITVAMPASRRYDLLTVVRLAKKPERCVGLVSPVNPSFRASSLPEAMSRA